MTQNGLDYTTKTIKVSSGIFPQPARQMLCPVCDSEWLHVDSAKIVSEWPLGKGHAAVLRFSGECDSVWDLYFGEHKGNMGTYIDIIRPCRHEVQMSYAEYIRSPEWEQRAKAAKRRAGWRCQVCNASAEQTQLDAHHRTYERLGNELPEDITVLCRDCHELYHARKKKEQDYIVVIERV